MDPTTFSDNLFDNPVKESHSIQLETEDMDMGDLFEFLLLVFTNGLRKLYGNENNKVNLGDLSKEQFEKVNKYFNSIGFDCTYVAYPLEVEKKIDFNKLSYRNVEITTKTQLDDLCFPMKVDDKIYIIGFKFKTM